MTFILTTSYETAAGKEFVPIATWAHTTLSDTEKLEFDNVRAERERWFVSLKLDGSIVQYSDLYAQTFTVEWVESPSEQGNPWTNSWLLFRDPWLHDTNQARVFELIEKQ